MANDLSLALRIKTTVDGLDSIGALIDEIKQLGGDSESAGKMAGHLGQELDGLARQQKLIDDFATLEREVTAASDALEASRAKTADLARQFNAADTPSKTLVKNFAAARAETRQLADQEERQRLALQQLRGEMSAAGLSSQKLALSQTQVRQAVTETEGRVAALRQRLTETRDQSARKFQDPTPDVRQGAQQAEQKVNSLGESFRNAAHKMAAWAAATLGLDAIHNGIQSIIDTGARFEQLDTRLTALMQSLEGGQKAVAWIKNFALTTPLQLGDVTEGFARLKTYGLDPMDGTMQALVDLTAKMGGGQELLQRVILAVGQAWTKQKLQGQEVMQLNEAGVPVWDLLSRAMGKSVIELQRLSEQGRLGREEIRLLIGEIGKSSTGASAAQMATWNGLISNLRDTWTNFLNTIAQSGALDYFKAQVKEVLDTAQQMAQDGSLQRMAKQTGDAIVSAAKAIKGAISTIIEFKDAILLTAKTFAVIKIANLTAGMISFAGSLAGKVIPALTSTAAVAEGAAGKVGLFGRILGSLSRNVTVAIAFVGIEAAIKGGEWLGETLAKLSPAARSAEAALQKVRDQAISNTTAAYEAAKAHQQYADVQIKSAAEVARLTAQERAAYLEALDGAKQYQLAIYRAALNQELLGQNTKAAQKDAGAALAALRESFKEVEKASRAAAQGLATQLSPAVKQLVQDFDRAKQEGKSVGEALTAMFGQDFAANSITAIRDMGNALEDLRRRGVITADQVRDAWSGVLKNLSSQDLAVFQASAQAAFGDTADQAGQLAGTLDATLAVSLAKLGLDVNELRTGIDDNIRAFDNLANNGAASAEMIRAALGKALNSATTRQEVELLRQLLVKLGQDGKLSMEEVTLATGDLTAKLQDAQREIDPLESAFKALGIISQQALQDAADKAQAAFEFIRNSAAAKLGDVENAFVAYAKKAIEANNGVISAELRGEAGVLGLSDALDKAGDAGKTAGDKIANAMSNAASETEKAAKAAEDLKNKQAEARTGFSAALGGNLLSERAALQQKYGDSAAAQFDALMKRDVIPGESVNLFMDRFGNDLERLKAHLQDIADIQANTAADRKRIEEANAARQNAPASGTTASPSPFFAVPFTPAVRPVPPSSPPTAIPRTVNIVLNQPNGKSINGQFSESDAEAFVAFLAQQGMRANG